MNAVYALPNWTNTRSVSPEEQLALLRRFRAGDRAAGDALTAAAVRFVAARVYRLCGRYLKGREDARDMFQDVLSEGLLGFTRSLNKYEEGRGANIISYAVHWIDAYIGNYMVRQSGPLVLGKTAEQRRLYFQLFRDLPEDADDELREKVEALRLMYQPALSLNRPAGDDDGREHLDLVEDDAPGPEDHLLREQERTEGERRLAAALRSLDAREAEVVRCRYLQSPAATLKALGEGFGVSRERTRQIEQRALGKLLRALRGEDSPALRREVLALWRAGERAAGTVDLPPGAGTPLRLAPSQPGPLKVRRRAAVPGTARAGRA